MDLQNFNDSPRQSTVRLTLLLGVRVYNFFNIYY